MKNRYLLIVLVFAGVNLVLSPGSGAPEEEWNVTYKDAGWIRDFILTSDGGYVFASNKLSGSFQEILLVKTDHKGNELWNRTFGGTGYNEAVSVVEMGDGGFVISGIHRKEFESGQSIILIRTDANGTELWNTTFVSVRSFNFDETSDGGIIIAGETDKFSEFLLSSITADGKEKWKKTIQAGERVMIDAISQTHDGGYIIAGNNESCCGWGMFDLWIMKTDPEGNVQWKKTFEKYRYDRVYSIDETSDGNYTFAGGNDCKSWVGVLSRAGEELWSKRFSRSDHRIFRMTPDGGYLASGKDSLMKIDPEGNKQWIVNFEKHGITSLKQSSDGGLIASANSGSDIMLVKSKRSATPFVSFTPEFPGAGQPVTFDASFSYDPDGNIAGYIWDFGDGNITRTKGRRIVHSYGAEGGYNVSLTLLHKDNTGTGFMIRGLQVQKSAPPEERWNMTYGGKFADWERSAGSTRDGGYIMAGETTFLYGIGAYLVKAGHEGIEEWNRTYPVIDGQSAAKSVVQTSDGGYVFTGSRQLHSESSQMIWLVKTDRDGNEEWNVTFGKPGSADHFSYNEGFSVIEDNNGSFVVTGIIDLVEGAGTGESKFGLLLAKTDKEGNKLWEKSWELNGSIEAYLVLESGEGYSVVGTSYMQSLMTTEAWLLKVDKNGNETWLKTYGGAGASPIAYSVVRTGDGGYLVSGNMWKYEDGAGNIIDLWIMKTDSDGNTLWKKTYPGKGYGSARYARESRGGGFLIMADGDGAGMWLIKTDANGSVLWHDRFDGSTPSSVIESPDGDYVIGGAKDDSCGNRDSDFLLMKLGSTVDAETVVKGSTGNEAAGAPGFEMVLTIFALVAIYRFKKDKK